ncbi:hypothetical protein U1Q18_027733 [Sarracenia purpurea var. burkii]
MPHSPTFLHGLHSQINSEVPRRPRHHFRRVQVGGDASKLRDDYGLSPGCTADIQALAMVRQPQRSFQMPGLKKLADEFALAKMEKPKHVCLDR